MKKSITVIGIESCLPAVREQYPTAWMEGSAGLGNTFCVSVDGGYTIVAYSNPKSTRLKRYL